MTNLTKVKHTKKYAKAQNFSTKQNEGNNKIKYSKINYSAINSTTHHCTCPICESNVIQEYNCPFCHLNNPNFSKKEFFGERNK